MLSTGLISDTARAPGYCLLGMLEGFGLRVVRDALPNNPVGEMEAQVRCNLTLYPWLCS
jgi:hypothetical protein